MNKIFDLHYRKEFFYLVYHVRYTPPLFVIVLKDRLNTFNDFENKQQGFMG